MHSFNALREWPVEALLRSVGRSRVEREALSRVLDGRVSLSKLSERCPSALRNLGLSEGLSTRLAAAFELGRRAQREMRGSQPVLTCAEEVAAYLSPSLVGLDHEELWVLVLSAQSRLKVARKAAAGGIMGCSVTAKEILRIGIEEAGVAIVLAHNHPSGDPRPSEEDLRMTVRIREAASVVGLPLVDHVIVAREGFRSLLCGEALEFDRS